MKSYNIISIYTRYNLRLSSEWVIQNLSFSEIRERNAQFGTSLLLANIGPNSPMTPKIINGSYAALFDNSDEVITEFSKKMSDMRKDIEGQGTSLSNRKRNDCMQLYVCKTRERSTSIWLFSILNVCVCFFQFNFAVFSLFNFDFFKLAYLMPLYNRVDEKVDSERTEARRQR